MAEEEKNKLLPKDQQKLADAVKEEGKELAVDVGESVLGEVALGTGLLAGGKALSTLGATGVGGISSTAGGAMLTPAGLAGAATFGAGYYAGKKIDEATGASTAIANAVSPDSNQPAITDAEKLAMVSNRDLNKPIEKQVPTLNLSNPYGAFAPPSVSVPTENYEIRESEKSGDPILDEAVSAKLAENEIFAREAMRQAEANVPQVPTDTSEEAQSAYQEDRLATQEINRPIVEEGFKNVDSTIPLELAQARNEARGDAEGDIYKAPDQEIESMYEKDGKMYGVQRGADISESVKNPLELTEDQVKSFQADIENTDAPVISGTPQEGLRAFRDVQGNIAYGNERAIQDDLDLDKRIDEANAKAKEDKKVFPAEEALINYKKFIDSGGVPTDRQIKQADIFAQSIGREFDKDLGYSKDFDPEIYAGYKRKVESGEIQLPQGQQRAPQGRSTYSTQSDAREDRIDQKSNFNRAYTRDSEGNKVYSGSKEQADMDFEKSLKQAARREGLSPAETRNYINEEKEKRRQAEEDRQRIIANDELARENTQSQIDNRNAIKIEPPKELTISQLNGITSLLEKQGVDYDITTGKMTTKEDKFMLPDGSVDLSPDSALYRLLQSTEEGRLFMQPPSDISYADVPMNGLVRSNDGRIYRMTENGLLQEF